MAAPRFIINADDFGLSPEVNAAVEQAHRQGVLTAASLMVGEAAAPAAVAIARRNPDLAVGLHLTLTEGRPVLPPAEIPALVGPGGRFHHDMAVLRRALVRSRAARQQLRAEVAAQFEAFAATGLACDHVNTHQHQHLHPVIALAVFRAAAAHGVRAARLPWEPRGMVRRVDAAAPRNPLGSLVRSARAGAYRWLAPCFGLRVPRRAIGQRWSGSFNAERLAALLAVPAGGVTEIYLHPATDGGFPGAAPGFGYAEELAALLDDRVRRAAGLVTTGGYAAMLA